MTRLSLKTRFVVGLGLMLLPLLVVIGVSFFTLNQLSDVSTRIAEEAVAEIAPVASLQEHLYRIEDEMHQVMHHQANPETVMALLPLIDKSYEQVLESPFSEREEREAVLGSHRAWLRVSSGWRKSLQNSGPVPSTLPVVEQQLRRAEQLLSQVRDVSLSEINLLHTQQHENRWTLGVFLGSVLLLGVGLSILIGVIFSRAVLRPVRALEAGVRQLGEGEMSARVTEVSHDELGDLARTFNQMAQKLEESHQELSNLSTVDYLTGLHNMREFYRLFHDETRRVDRYGHCFSLLIIDVDRFKEINDTFGHQLGDYVLQEVSRTLLKLLRSSDYAARIGGDEFAVLLPETAMEQASELGERIRAYFAAHAIAQNDHPDEAIQITVSIGLASYPQAAGDANELFAVADSALYRAKNGGRNQLCLAGGEGVAPGG